MDTAVEELEKCECVPSVMTISSVLHIEKEPMGPVGILLTIDDGVYVCICSVFPIFQIYGHNAHFSMTVILRQHKLVHVKVQS